MAGVGRRMAMGMQNFAYGVMREIDGGTLDKAVKKAINSGINSDIAHKSAVNITKSSGYAFGSAVASAKPMMGMTQTARHVMGTNGAQKLNLGQAIKQGHMIADSTAKGGQRLSKARVAGTAATLGVAGRVATGGGLYRDRYGNVNIPGLPFI